MKKTRIIIISCCLLLSAGCAWRPVPAQTGAPVAAPDTAPEPSPEPEAPATPAPTPEPTPEPTPSPTPEPTPCPHLTWVDGVCMDCGEICRHPGWENGRCVVCESFCPHPAHNGDTLACLTCGQTVPHNFLNSCCNMCGEEPEFIHDLVPRKLFNAIDRQGLVETLSYTTQNYAAQLHGAAPVSYSKDIQVYAPYGYNRGERYDVLILVHGMGGTETYWLSDAQEYQLHDLDTVRTSRLLDNLMDSGYSRKMIIAAPCFYRDGAKQGEYIRPDDEIQFVRELREDILPLIINRYSTYALGTKPEQIAAARDHFAYAGLSMGSIYAYNSIIPQCLDYFSWFGCFSGSDGNMKAVAEAVNKEIAEGYPIHYFYNSISNRDSMFNLHSGQYKELVGLVDGLTDGENAVFTEVYGGGHVYQAWCTGLYNFLRVLFAQPLEH